jgi:hypothetical protein
METDPKKTYAVISGDIIRSSRLDPAARQELPRILKQAAAALREFLGEAIPLDIDIYAGDSWQLLLTDPGSALRAAVFLRAHLLDRAEGLDTRVAVAIGGVDFVPGERVSEGDGEAFRISGRLLQENAPGRRMRFASNQSTDGGLWDVAFDLIDALTTKTWTPRRARAVSGALRGWVHTRIADLWTPSVRQPTVAKGLEEASWPVIQRTIERFEREFKTRNL